MLTGDGTRVAGAVARACGVDEFHADLLPQDKVRVIKKLKKRSPGKTAMIGDGVNDAPALATCGNRRGHGRRRDRCRHGNRRRRPDE